jgi:hypothetical protein
MIGMLDGERDGTPARSTHSVCPDCMLRLYPDYPPGKADGPD